MNKSNDILIYNDIWYGNLRLENSKDFECYHKLNIADFKKILLDLNFKIVEIPTLSKKRTDIHFFKVLDKNNNRYNKVGNYFWTKTKFIHFYYTNNLYTLMDSFNLIFSEFLHYCNNQWNLQFHDPILWMTFS